MCYNLFIDDERLPRDVTWASPLIRARYITQPWVLARNIIDVMDIIRWSGFPQFISFDHDLGENQPTGHDIAKWLVSQDMIEQDWEDMEDYSFPKDFDFYVHSQNPVGKKNIEGYLGQYLQFRKGN